MRQTLSVLLLSASLLISACAHRGMSEHGPAFTEADELAIRTLLETQDAAWNAGDVDGFMDGYWVSPELRFASGGTVTRGYQETLDRYKQRYPNRDLMGQLSFDELEIVPLGEDAAVVHGRWLLTRENDTPGGLFTLIFRRIDGSWNIVSDTTTSAD